MTEVTHEQACDVYGANLDRLIEESGLSLNEVARRSGVDPGSLHRLRSGQREASVSKAQLIATYFGTTIDEMLMTPHHSVLRKWREKFQSIATA